MNIREAYYLVWETVYDKDTNDTPVWITSQDESALFDVIYEDEIFFDCGIEYLDVVGVVVNSDIFNSILTT